MRLLNPSPTAHGAVAAKAKTNSKKENLKPKSNAIPSPAPAVLAVEIAETTRMTHVPMGTGADSLMKGKVVVYRRLKLNPKRSFEALSKSHL